MRAIEDVEVIVAIELQAIEPEHEALEDAVRLESNGAIERSLVLRRYDGPLDLPVKISQEVILANVCHLNCKSKRKSKVSSCHISLSWEGVSSSIQYGITSRFMTFIPLS